MSSKGIPEARRTMQLHFRCHFGKLEMILGNIFTRSALLLFDRYEALCYGISALRKKRVELVGVPACT